MGGMFSCHSELKHCKAELQRYTNPMLGTVDHKLKHKGENEPKVGGKRKSRYRNKTHNTRRR